MGTITLPRTGQASLKFTGEEIARVEGKFHNGQEHNRFHDLAVWQLADGGFAVQIAYVTCWQGESDTSRVEIVPDAAAVGRLLADHDPTCDVVGFPATISQYGERQQKLLADVTRRYKDRVTRLLADEVFAVSPEDVTAEATADLEQQLDLRRYRRLLDMGLRKCELTRDEACAVCDALNGCDMALYDDHDHWPFAWVEIEDACRLNGLAEKWSIDGPALVRKLRESPPHVQIAVVDAAERFWRHHTDKDTDDALRAVGFLPVGGRVHRELMSAEQELLDTARRETEAQRPEIVAEGRRVKHRSAKVTATLEIGGHTLSLHKIGPSDCRLKAPVDCEIPAGDAMLTIVVNGKPTQHPVYLPDPIRPGDMDIQHFPAPGPGEQD